MTGSEIRQELLSFRRGHGWTWFTPKSQTEWESLSTVLTNHRKSKSFCSTIYVQIIIPKFEGWEYDPNQTLDGEDIVWLIGQNLQWVVVRESE